MVEYLLEHIHIWGGIPWWASIVTLAVVIRALTFPLIVRATDQQAKMVKFRPQVKEIQGRLTEAARSKDEPGVLRARMELKSLYKQHGVKPLTSIMPMFIMGPAGFGQFRLGRGMADLPVPALENESFLWLPDMTMSDPFFIMPVATALIVWQTMAVCYSPLPPTLPKPPTNLPLPQRGGEFGSSGSFSEGMRIFTTYVIPTMTGVFMLLWPATLQLYFCVSSIIGFITSSLLRNPGIRARLGVGPLPVKPSTPESLTAAINKIETPVEAAARIAKERRSVVDKGLENITGGFNKMKESAKDSIARQGYNVGDKGAKGNKRSSQEIRTAEAYEERRRRELEMERAAREERRRERGSRGRK
jgi:YidC/Oxa1 family membrane protein insertase